MKFKLVLFLAIISIFSGCTGHNEGQSDNSVYLTLGAYTVPKEAYQQQIIPGFKKFWKEKTGQQVIFRESYMASGAQSRTIASGFEADVAALSLEKDVERLRSENLITHNWKSKRFNGFVTRSLVIAAFRPGNPKNIKTWDDLKRNDVDVIYPSPKTSGGAMWIVNAIYGSRLKTTESSQGTADANAAREFLKAVQKRVKVMDKSGRSSVTTYENGVGDVLLTYENEALLRKKQGKDFPYLIPKSTILIENPIAVIDKNVDKHKNRAVAEAFVDYVQSSECQRIFSQYGFRPVDPEVAREVEDQYPVPELLFDINYLGGWNRVAELIYGPKGIWSSIIMELANEY